MKRGKLKREDGTTLVELLAAVIVLILFSMMVNTGLQIALKCYHAMTYDAETQILLSTVANTITGELRYTKDVTADAGEIKFTSPYYGQDCTVVIDEVNGHLKMKNKNGVLKELIASGAYGKGGIYKVQELDMSYDADEAVFHVKFSVGGDGGNPVSTEISVRCVNGPCPTASPVPGGP